MNVWHSIKTGPKSKKQLIRSNIGSMYQLVVVGPNPNPGKSEEKSLKTITYSSTASWESIVKMFNIESWAYYNDVIKDALKVAE